MAGSGMGVTRMPFVSIRALALPTTERTNIMAHKDIKSFFILFLIKSLLIF